MQPRSVSMQHKTDSAQAQESEDPKHYKIVLIV